jgi:hypothetical protein
VTDITSIPPTPNQIDKNQELIDEIKKLTYQIKLQNQPWRRIGRSFTNGFFASLGSLLGTLILVSILSYFLLQQPFFKNLTNFFQNPPKSNSRLELFLPSLFPKPSP